jgi:hypothetical protein
VRRFTTIHSSIEDAASFQIHALRLTLFRSVLIETYLTPVFHSVIAAETGHDAIRDPKVATFADYGNFTAVNRTSLLMQRRSLILPCTNYCNKER